MSPKSFWRSAVAIGISVAAIWTLADGASTSGRPRLGYTTAARASGTLTPFACPQRRHATG
jgi:hypothetical protein